MRASVRASERASVRARARPDVCAHEWVRVRVHACVCAYMVRASVSVCARANRAVRIVGATMRSHMLIYKAESGVGVAMAMCSDQCRDMCTDMCTDMCADMCINTAMRMFRWFRSLFGDVEVQDHDTG